MNLRDSVFRIFAQHASPKAVYSMQSLYHSARMLVCPRALKRWSLGIGNRPSDFPHYLSIVAIAKNEAEYIAEWIEYHLLVGVTKFYIYDNDSTDNLFEVLKPYIAEGIVEYKNGASGFCV